MRKSIFLPETADGDAHLFDPQEMLRREWQCVVWGVILNPTSFQKPQKKVVRYWFPFLLQMAAELIKDSLEVIADADDGLNRLLNYPLKETIARCGNCIHCRQGYLYTA